MAPGLATMAPPRQEIGARTAELLLAQLHRAAPVQRLKLDCPLVVRGSTGG